jgi:hypothetical protein
MTVRKQSSISLHREKLKRGGRDREGGRKGEKERPG